MRNGTIRLIIDSVPEHVFLVGVAVNKICAEAGFGQETADQIELCVVEAVNNAIEHAYKNTAGNDVEVMIELTSSGITVKVCDAGESMRSLKQSKLDFDPSDIANLPEGGMGLYLIQQIMDTVRYESFGKKNILTMTKKLTI